ncbi:GIY-YIG nuclease family protein [Sphingobacterium spiritivorum]|uniref:GIY-YIG nuclease family protein n=1 Tax=Sphingobacterium spiritivorum TaxID=258 RepID=UPI003DA3F7DA
MTDDVIEAITKTLKPIKDFENLPTEMGIYAFYLEETTEMGIFGNKGQLIYVGIAKKSLNSRIFKTHLKTGQTGFSSLRRSLGAVLKTKLHLLAQKRDLNPKKLRADKYKFDEKGETELTAWIFENLKMGYWSPTNPLTVTRLREEEEKVIIRLKPTLDLDERTKYLNPLAVKLDGLRDICRQEVKMNNQI